MREYERKFHERCKRIDQYVGPFKYDPNEFSTPDLYGDPPVNVPATVSWCVCLYALITWAVTT